MKRPVIDWLRSISCGVLLCFAAATLGAQDIKPHVADAMREYAAIFSHPDAVCTGADASSTVGYETCMNKELTFLEPHLDAFVAAVRAIEAATAPPAFTQDKFSALQIFDKTTAAWKVYRDSLCQLASSGFGGGTGAAPAAMQCLYEQDRAYVKSVANWTWLKILAH